MTTNIHATIRTISGNGVMGYILSGGEIGKVISVIDDFILDGYAFFATEGIENVEQRDSTTDHFFEKVLRDNGVTGSVDFSKSYVLKTYEEFLQNHLLKTDVMIEKNDGETIFGRILDTSEDAFLVHTFNSDATWSHKREIFYSEILEIYWGNRYLRAFSENLGSID